MQILGLAESTPRSESRWRTLFWPTIRNDSDFDYVTHQGFWICIAVAATSFITGIVIPSIFPLRQTPHHDSRDALIQTLFFLLAAMGVRERSRTAALSAFVTYLFTAFVITRAGGNGFGVARILFLALLFANIRGNWLSCRWPRDPHPLRLNGTLSEKLSDTLPAWLWPKAKHVFYLFAVAELSHLLVALVAPNAL